MKRIRNTIPLPSSGAAHNRMVAVRKRGTKSELELQEALSNLGLDYLVDSQPISELRRRADILFEHEKVAVFVDGCFWHGCPEHGTFAKANADFWAKKIERNKERDKDTNEKLAQAGWIVIRIWEHEDSKISAERIQTLLQNIRAE